MKDSVSIPRGLLALSPIGVFFALYISLSLIKWDFYCVPITVAFIFSSIYSIAILRGDIEQRIGTFCKGAAKKDLIMMVVIFILAGAFAQSAKGMGAIDATVALVLSILPSKLVYGGLFLSACLISLSVGTSVGTIVALVPIATGIANQTGENAAMLTAIIVGGAYFGDNLSFISDTTIVATKSVGCDLKDKFKMNIRVVTPAAIITFLIYLVIGWQAELPATPQHVDWILVVPYITVFVTAMAGMNVMAVLALGFALTGIIGIFQGKYTFYTWMESMNVGVMNMSELIVVTILAACMVEVIREMKGIDFIMQKLTQNIKDKRGAELAIAALVAVTDIATANNTIAVLTTGPLANDIAKRFHIDPRRAASILDTFSCFAQGLIPYGAQMLIASQLCGVSPMEIIPWLLYPLLVGISATIWIITTSRKQAYNGIN